MPLGGVSFIPPIGANPQIRDRAAYSAAPRGGPDRACVLGCEIDRVDLSQAVTVCQQVIEKRAYAQHVAINVAKLIAMRDDALLRDSVSQCELITADGQPVVWASRLLRDPLPQRVAGIDLMQSLLTLAAVQGYRVYVLGARRDVLESAVARIRDLHPALAVVGYHHGYYDESDEQAIATEIAATRPDMLFVAMSSPRKEYFLARYRQTMGVPFVMGVGGSIDVIAGVRRRAPLVFRRLGLEWLFRLLQEPRRLARRYASTNTRFVLLVIRELCKMRAARRTGLP